jgi:opacity protein-like surface antigen
MSYFDGLNQTPASPRKAAAKARAIFTMGLVLLSLLAARSAFGQVSESANIGGHLVWIGSGVSGYYLQYGSVKNLGVTAYVDADSIRRIGFEAEGRWLQFHETNNISADTYLGGPRYHFNMGRYQPYVKGLGGLGLFNFTYNYAHGSYFVIAPGAGIDYRVSPRWSVRVDGEYQYWPQFTFGSMTSGGVTVGVRYLLLR